MSSQIIAKDTPLFEVYTETELEQWRVDTFWDKEPETLRWIEGFIGQGAFIDIGANIGLYSLYAACLHPDMLIYPIEPQIHNFARLCENITLNPFPMIFPYYAGAGEKSGISGFSYTDITSGSSTGQVILGLSEPYQPDEAFFRFVQVYRMDDLLTNFYYPLYIKIDTDGYEKFVLAGLQDKDILNKIAGMLIEVDMIYKDGDSYPILDYLLDNGFYYSELNFIKTFDGIPHSRERRRKEGIKVENIILKRKENVHVH